MFTNPQMPEITTVIFDNALNSQNQDYFPSRIVLQKEVIEEMITRLLEANIENLIGLIPLGQKVPNDILTPTKSRPHISTFLHKTDLANILSHSLCFYQADQSLQVAFLSSPVEHFDEAFANLYNIVSKGVNVRIICFGDAIEFGYFLENELRFENFKCLIVESEQNFNEVVGNFLTSSYEIDDPELEEAIRRSLQN